jgi:hypothetical protein
MKTKTLIMKTKTLFFLFTFGFIFFHTISCKGQSNFSEERALCMLNNFYKSYITENGKIPTNVSKVNSLKKNYCTAKLLHKIKREDLDYDIFLKAQDSDPEWLKTLSIKKDKKGSNQYSVSYTDPYNKNQIIIKLIIVKEKDLYKIDSIF